MVEIEGVDPMMIASNLKPKYVTHPGEVIMDEIEYMQITQKEFAERIGVSCSQVNQILKGKRPVNTEFALLTEAATGIPADLLLRMQTRYDRIKDENKADFIEKLNKIKKFAAALYRTSRLPDDNKTEVKSVGALFPVKCKQGRTGAGHGSIDSSRIVERALDGGQFRILYKYSFLEIIDKNTVPLFHRPRKCLS